MARKPNYRFERQQKDRAKAAKKAERLEAKRTRTAKADQPEDAGDHTGRSDGEDGDATAPAPHQLRQD